MKQKKWILILIVVLVGAAWARSMVVAQPDDVQKMTMRVKPAVVLVQTTIEGYPVLGSHYFDRDRWGSRGSGFIINSDGYLITNGHVVRRVAEKDKPEQRREIKEMFFWRFLARYVFPVEAKKAGRNLTDDEKEALAQRYRPYFWVDDLRLGVKVVLPNWTRLTAEIKRYSPTIDEGGKDIAILKIEAKNLPTVNLGDSDKVQEQDLVLPVGYPGAAQNDLISDESYLSPTITSGHVSALKLDIKGTPVIQTDAVIAPGSSGGPAFNQRGEVIGVSTFGNPDTAGFNFLVPVNTAKEFVQESGISTNQASLFDQLWGESLALYYSGKHRSAIAKFDEVLRSLPNYDEAKKLQLKSQEYVIRHPLISHLNELNGMMVGGVLAVILVVAGVVLTVKKRPAAILPARAPRALAASQPVLPKQKVGLLICTAGSLAGRTFDIDKKGLLIGRDSSKCQVILSSENVSREHAWVVPVEGDKVVVIDRNSSNGTFVNSVESARVRKLALNAGDTIIIGKMAVAKFTYQPN